LLNQFRTTVDAGIRSDPDSIVQTARLVLVQRLLRRAKLGMTEAHGTVDPDILPIRSAIGHRMRQLLEERRLDRRTIQIKEANDAAHDASPTLAGNTARSNVAKRSRTSL